MDDDSISRRRTVKGPLFWLWVWIGLLFLGGLITVATVGGDGKKAARPNSTSATTTDPKKTTTTTADPFKDFETIAFRIDAPAGEGIQPKTFQGCAVLAKARKQLAEGMMKKPGFGDLDGMIFLFDKPVEEKFYMKNVKIPLSVAWYDDKGEFVAWADMPTCPDGKCTLFEAGRPYRFAIEVPVGRLVPMGVGAGSKMSLGKSCEPGAKT